MRNGQAAEGGVVLSVPPQKKNQSRKLVAPRAVVQFKMADTVGECVARSSVETFPDLIV